MVDNLRASGVHVIGDLATLCSGKPGGTADPVTQIDVQIAVSAVLGTAKAGGAGILQERYVNPRDLRRYPGVSSAPTSLLTKELGRRDHDPLAGVASAQIVEELRRRVWRKLRRDGAR